MVMPCQVASVTTMLLRSAVEYLDQAMMVIVVVGLGSLEETISQELG